MDEDTYFYLFTYLFLQEDSEISLRMRLSNAIPLVKRDLKKLLLKKEIFLFLIII